MIGIVSLAKKFGYKWMLFGLIVLLLVSCVFVYSFNSDSKTHNVLLTEEGFTPSKLIIRKGDVVVFSTNRGERFWPASDLHPLHDIYSEFDPQKSVEPSKTWSFRFNKIGVWKYHDHLFPYYKGVIEVVDKEDIVTDFRGSELSQSQAKALVQEVLDKNGAEKAYGVLVKYLSTFSDGASHNAMHIFGEELFLKTGEKGIVYCGSEFGFGCFHGFISRAVGENGVDSAIAIDKYCVEKYGLMGLGCPHGIGHGLGEYFGPSKINEQLDVCRQLSWKGSLLGCSGGVFMEALLTSKPEVKENKVVLEKTKEEPFFICNLIGVDFKNSCYFELPQAWYFEIGMKPKQMESLCDDLKNINNKRFCLMGVGYAMLVKDQAKEDSRLRCEEMNNKMNVAYCYSGIAWGLFANEGKTDQINIFCSALVGENKNICNDYQIALREMR